MKRYPDPDIRMLAHNLRIILAELENRYDLPKDDPLAGGWDFLTPPRTSDEVHIHTDPLYPKRRSRILFEPVSAQAFVQQRRQRRKR